MNLTFFYLLSTYYVIYLSQATPPKKQLYFQIDEFIKQLMTSEKFDQLAEVIADKAAKKIKKMEGHVESNFETALLRQGSKNRKNETQSEEKQSFHSEKTQKKDSRSTEQQSNYDRQNNKVKDTRSIEKPNYDQTHIKEKDSRSSEKSNYMHDKNKEKDFKSNEKSNRDSENKSFSDKKEKYRKPVKFGNIDTQAFLNNHMMSKELELNFKHLKRELEKRRFDVKGNSIKSQKEYNKDKHNGAYNENNRAIDKHESDKSDESQAENNASQEEKHDGSKEIKLSDDSSNENAAHEQATFHGIANEKLDGLNSRASRSANRSESANEETKISKYRYNEPNSNEKPIPRIEKQSKDSADATKSMELNENNTAIDESTRKTSRERNGSTYPSNEIVVVGLNNAHSNEEIDERRHSPEKRRRIREENGKLFTLETSLEYAEYHENAAKRVTMEDGSTSGLVFIDVEAKPPIPAIKEERSSSPDEKLSEIKDQNNAGKLQCSECNYSTVLAERMTRHIRKVHRGQNPYQCAMCDYSAYNSTLFTEHVNIHKGVKPYKCSFCPYRSVSKKYIKLHEQKHGSCDKCGFAAHNRRDMKRHRRETGCGAGDASNTFRCDNCDQSYDNRVSLKQHKKNHKACYVCGKSFSHQVLVTHFATQHGIQVVPDKRKKIKFNCGLCDWSSNCTQKILLHIIHHPNQPLSDELDITPLVSAGILPARITKIQP